MNYTSKTGQYLKVDFSGMNNDTLDNLIREASKEQAKREKAIQDRYSNIDDDLDIFSD